MLTQCGGFICKGRNVQECVPDDITGHFLDMSTLEDETITLSQNVRNQLPVMKHCIPDEWVPPDTLIWN